MRALQRAVKNQKLSVGNFGLKFDAKQTLGCKKNLLINIVFFYTHYTRLRNIFCDTLTGLVLDCFVTEMLPVAALSKQ